MTDPGARMIPVATFVDERGVLDVTDLPFEAHRVFVLHDLVDGATRGEHANRATHELIICVAGTITATVDDGDGERSIVLDEPTSALHVPPLVWIRLHDHAPGSVVVVAASNHYDPADAIRDREEHRRLASGG